MDRLTERDNDGRIYVIDLPSFYLPPETNLRLQNVVGRLAAYEDLMERWAIRDVDEIDRYLHRINAIGGLDHAADLVRAERDGRLVVLPCRVGDVLWDTESLTEKPSRHIVLCFDVLRSINMVHLSGGQSLPVSQIGKTVFLTREEAEKALEKMNNKPIF